ncbi:MAG: hypothetical protein K9L98_01945 [Candidatus Pacebacteria bacterium]|nr:hypothetical protein [Candidatus Paceibacterota bacterium]MCF7862750.1 hypothetical protein [Candidatus Paceibacterota bacterium]
MNTLSKTIKKNRGFFDLKLIIIIILVLGIGTYFVWSNNQNTQNIDQMNTQENASIDTSSPELAFGEDIKENITEAEYYPPVNSKPSNEDRDRLWKKSSLFNIWYLDGMNIKEYYQESSNPYGAKVKAETFEAVDSSARFVIRWGGHYWAMVDGTGSACDQNTFKGEQYDDTRVACIKGIVAQITGENLKINDLELFREFVSRNK